MPGNAGHSATAQGEAELCLQLASAAKLLRAQLGMESVGSTARQLLDEAIRLAQEQFGANGMVTISVADKDNLLDTIIARLEDG